MNTRLLALFVCFCFSFITHNIYGQTIIDEAVFGDASMANDLFVFEDGSRVVIENNLDWCTVYNLKHFDNNGQLVRYFSGPFNDMPSTYKWEKDSLVFISVTDGHDVPIIQIISRNVYNHDNKAIDTREIFISTEDSPYIEGHKYGQQTAYDNKSIVMVVENGGLYWMLTDEGSTIASLFDFERRISPGHLFLKSMSNDTELMINMYDENEGWLYFLHYLSPSDISLDSIAIDNVVGIEEVDDNLLVVTNDNITLLSRDLEVIETIIFENQVEFINSFDKRFYFKLSDTEVQASHHRKSVDIAVFDGITMSWTETLPIEDAPQVIDKVLYMDSIVHILGTYIDNNQSVIQRHLTSPTTSQEAKTSDLEIVDYYVTSSQLTQSDFSPMSAKAVFHVTLKKSDPQPYDKVFHLARVGSANLFCQPHIMAVNQGDFDAEGFIELSFLAQTISISEVGDSLLAKFKCSLFLPHGSPMNENLDKNYLCPEVKFSKDILSTSHVDKGVSIDISPNPATDILLITIESDQLSTGTFMIYNSLGAIVTSGDVRADTNAIDIHRLAPGMYTLFIFDGQQSQLWGSRKFVKQ